MSDIKTLEQVPVAVGLILEKLSALEIEMAELKAKYESAPAAPKSDDELLTVKEACVFLKIKQNALYRWKREKLIPYTKIGSRTYFKKLDLENYSKLDIRKIKRR
ncbi:helix-turn-helix domain-containing protein [Sphingobacterium paludis]|uniref:Excisionase family DNA binding protein n=1 Tax=Sphingobacterium paludis TaxID=1476465 RepID=A0A4R7D1Y9_9SPHI|nr:helix-turn-helix domain-containing protein [Sphingobacterium paludis]TDS14770.1 excisionase family DNA binding protein [Sphingobacterium paludis]